MISNRGLPRKQKPHVLVQFVPPAKWLLEFDTWTFRHEIASYLFQSGTLPDGFGLEPTHGGNPTHRWRLAWQGRMKDHLTKLTELGIELYERTQGGFTVGSYQGDEFPEDRWKREQEEALAREANNQRNEKFLPSLNMTAEKAMRTLKPGNYVAALYRRIVSLSPMQPGDTYPPDVDWLRNYQHGHFVQVSRERSMTIVPVRDFEQFWRDIVWFLKQGSTLSDAVKKFDERWDELYFMMVAGFALALTGATSLGRRADLGETAFATAARDANRMIGREVRPPTRFGTISSQIDRLEAAEVGVSGTGMAMQWAHMKEDIGRKKEELELESLGESITSALEGKIGGVPQKQIEKDLRTGQLGEAVIKKTLELRGYAVVELQNASGHGVDLVGVKVKGDLIVYVEVKSSATDHSGSLSEAQKNPHQFIRSRLERVVAHEGFYRNVSDKVVEIAKILIAEIDAGRPIGGIRVTVKWLSKGLAVVKVRHWKASLPKATGVGRRK